MSRAEKLKNVGWTITTIPNLREFDKYLIKIAMTLGEPRRLRTSGEIVQKLSPITASTAHPHSLSSKHSFGAFPMHTDTAHWPMPCRYVILGCSNEGSGARRTKLLDFKSLSVPKIETNLLYSTPFRIVNGRNSFFSNILSTHRDFIRYDPGCMNPTSSSGNEVLEILSEKRWKQETKEIEWKAGNVLILDNWRILHGRGTSSNKDSDRLLHRILIA
jgi:Taurine catabolism dioxygenase TauD, TfdA family